MGERVGRAMGGLVERHAGETVVVACHGGVVVHAMFHFLGLDPDGGGTRAWIAPDNTSLTEFRFAPNPYVKATMPVQLVRYNDHAHLGALERQPHSI
jgi:broad specificity phosphatase PhoE